MLANSASLGKNVEQVTCPARLWEKLRLSILELQDVVTRRFGSFYHKRVLYDVPDEGAIEGFQGLFTEG